MNKQLCSLVVVGVVAVGALLAQNSQARADEKSISDLTSSQLQKVFDTLVPNGWRLSQIEGYAAGNESRYNCVFVRQGGPAFVSRHNLSAEDFRRSNQDLGFGGYRIKLQSTWKVNGQFRYWGYWEKD